MAWPTLLHQDGSNKYIQNLQGEKFFNQIVVELRVHIIDIRFDHCDLLIFGSGCHSADEQPQEVRMGKVIPSSPTPYFLYLDWRYWAKLKTHCGKNGGSCRCEKFSFHSRGINGFSFHQRKRGWRRNGKNPVLTFYEPCSYIYLRDMDSFNPQLSKTPYRPHDIDDRIQSTQFMEVNFFHWGLMY